MAWLPFIAIIAGLAPAAMAAITSPAPNATLYPAQVFRVVWDSRDFAVNASIEIILMLSGYASATMTNIASYPYPNNASAVLKIPIPNTGYYDWTVRAHVCPDNHRRSHSFLLPLLPTTTTGSTSSKNPPCRP